MVEVKIPPLVEISTDTGQGTTQPGSHRRNLADTQALFLRSITHLYSQMHHRQRIGVRVASGWRRSDQRPPHSFNQVVILPGMITATGRKSPRPYRDPIFRPADRCQLKTERTYRFRRRDQELPCWRKYWINRTSSN